MMIRALFVTFLGLAHGQQIWNSPLYNNYGQVPFNPFYQQAMPSYTSYNPFSSYSSVFGNNLLNYMNAPSSQWSSNSFNNLYNSAPEPASEENPIQSAQYAPDLYGSLLCIEPGKRFLSKIQHKITHNTDIKDTPEKWVCQFCGSKLMALVKKICCGENFRKRREIEEQDFWLKATLQEDKRISPSPDSFEVEESADDKLGDDLLSQNENHPQNIMRKQVHSDCMHDLQHKNTADLSKIPKNSRKKRSSNDNSDWAKSIRNGSKGRKTVKEIANIECNKASANLFLNNAPGATPDRSQYRHTFIQRECCGIWHNKKCDQAELDGSNLQEECCGEGCMYEEIQENCDSWRWNKKG